MKNTYKIPEGCTSISIEQIGNKIVTEFECSPQKYKDGDIVLVNWDYAHDAPAILKDYNMGSCHVAIATDKDNMPIYNHIITNTNIIRCANQSEKQLLFDALAKAGKQWNSETLQIEDLKVEPKVGDCVKCIYTNVTLYSKIMNALEDRLEFNSNLQVRKNTDIISHSKWFLNEPNSSIQILTPSQFQSEVNALGFEYDFKNDTFNELRWVPKEGDKVFTIYIDAMETLCQELIYNPKWHKTDNIFKTKSECESAIEKIKNVLKSK